MQSFSWESPSCSKHARCIVDGHTSQGPCRQAQSGNSARETRRTAGSCGFRTALGAESAVVGNAFVEVERFAPQPRWRVVCMARPVAARTSISTERLVGSVASEAAARHPSHRPFAVSSAERLREMSEQQRRWSWWAARGAVAMAALAALSLAITVLVAHQALRDAADVLVRGEGDPLVTSVVVDLAEAVWPPTTTTLAVVLAKHEAQGLRYVALVDRHDHRTLVEAGAAAIANAAQLPGVVVRQERRARLVDALARLFARRRDIDELIE